jgi:hypothetical protein
MVVEGNNQLAQLQALCACEAFHLPEVYQPYVCVYTYIYVCVYIYQPSVYVCVYIYQPYHIPP